MFEPAHSDLFEGSILEPEHVLSDHWMLVGAGDPIQFFGADIARGGSHGESIIAAGVAVTLGAGQLSNDDICTGSSESSTGIALCLHRAGREDQDGSAKKKEYGRQIFLTERHVSPFKVVRDIEIWFDRSPALPITKNRTGKERAYGSPP